MKKIVVIDDDENGTELLEYSFGKQGFKTISFNDALEAKHYLEDHLVDVIISDWMMPKLNGVDLIISLNGSVNNKTPKVMVSCIQNPESIRLAKSSGVDMYFSKPAKSTDILYAIMQLLS